MTTHTLTIDELAAASRVPSRTIRFYQARCLLPRPEMRGRVAYYSESHIERLKLIAELQDRGLQIKAISDLVERIDKGELAVQEWLGLEDQLKEPWAQDQPRIVSTRELEEMAGPSRPGRISELIRARLIERQGDSFLVPSPAMLQLAVKLEAQGIEIATAVSAENLVRKQMSRMASELTALFISAGGEVKSKSVAGLRPIALDAIRLVFAQEMERVLRELVTSGKTVKLARKRRHR